jgi:cell division protein FtsL
MRERAAPMTLDWSPDLKSRNYRISRSADSRSLTNMFAGVLCVLLVASSFVCYLWTQNQVVRLGFEEQRLQDAEQNLMRMQTGLILEEEMLKRPERIDFIARNLLAMEPLGPYQRVTPRFREIGATRPDSLLLAGMNRPGEANRRVAGQNAND